MKNRRLEPHMYICISCKRETQYKVQDAKVTKRQGPGWTEYNGCHFVNSIAKQISLQYSFKFVSESSIKIKFLILYVYILLFPTSVQGFTHETGDFLLYKNLLYTKYFVHSYTVNVVFTLSYQKRIVYRLTDDTQAIYSCNYDQVQWHIHSVNAAMG